MSLPGNEGEPVLIKWWKTKLNVINYSVLGKAKSNKLNGTKLILNELDKAVMGRFLM